MSNNNDELFAGVPPLDENDIRQSRLTAASARLRSLLERRDLEGMSHKELVDYSLAVQNEFRLADKENEFISWEHHNNLAFFSRIANIAHQLNTVKLNSVVDIAVDEVAEHFKCSAAAFFSYNPEYRSFDLVRSSNRADMEDYGGNKIFASKLFVSRDEPYLIDYNPDSGLLRFEDGEVFDGAIPAGWGAMFKDRALVLPLKAQTQAPDAVQPEPLGGLILGDAAVRLEGKDAEAAYIFADLLSASLHNALLVTKLNELIIIDPLTRIFNRRHLMSELTREMSSATRQGHTLSVVMADIDYFKSFNDMHGHLRGDEVIRGVADVLRENLRVGVDFVARYGGEEFVVVLPFTGLESATEVCERLRRKIEERCLGESVGRFGRTVLGVTCSFGVTEFVKGESLEDMIHRADQAMYDSKKAGKNRVTAVSGEAGAGEEAREVQKSS